MSQELSTTNFAEICPVTQENGQQWVDARRLHGALQSGQHFANWFKNRVKQYGFVENEDFKKVNDDNIIHLCHRNGAVPKPIDYAITLDMAKELAMVENNEMGRKVRRYFIACEKAMWAMYRERGDRLALEAEGLRRELAFMAHMNRINANAVDEHKKRRGQIATRREAKTMSENRRLKRQVADLENTLGLGKEWFKVAALDWLADYFEESCAMRTAVGAELTRLSKLMQEPVHYLERRRLYHTRVVNSFKTRLAWDMDYMAKYRKRCKAITT